MGVFSSGRFSYSFPASLPPTPLGTGVGGFFSTPPFMKQELRDRAQQRRIAAQCDALVTLLNELYPATDLPDLNSTEREIGAWIGQRELVRRLNILRDEANKAPGTTTDIPR